MLKPPPAAVRQGRYPAEYRASHSRLLVPLDALPQPVRAGAATRPLIGSHDREIPRLGILVPTSRSLAHHRPGLALAIDVALELDCPLMVICSQQADPADFDPHLRNQLGPLLTLVRLDQVDPVWKPQLAITGDRLNRLLRSNDVGAKRNLGLAMAVRRGWQQLLLLDDDIVATDQAVTLDPVRLRQAAITLEQHPSLRAIGWQVEYFRDNSVIGHARRVVGLEQDVFLGAGALLVQTDEQVPFFADVYNEDWLFLIALAAGATHPQRALGVAGQVRQQPFDPFQVGRAKSEEAGEILGECLMNLLEDHGKAFHQMSTPSFWRQALFCRWQLLQQISSLAGTYPDSRFAALGPHGRDRLTAAVGAAASVHREIDRMDLLGFVKTWRRDAAVWRVHLARLAQSGPMDFS